MSFVYYVEACHRLKWELIESLSDENVAELREDCTILGLEGWDEWIAKNTEEMIAFVSAPPSKRAALKKWSEAKTRNRLVLAGIQHVSRAYNLLNGIEENHIYEGLSYREMSSRAGWALYDICHKRHIDLWPFDDPDPFEDDP